MGVSRFCHSLIIFCIASVAHNFTVLHSGRADLGYLTFGEPSRFVYCLLQKKEIFWFACEWKMGGIHAPKSFVLWGHWRKTIPGSDPSVIVPWKNKRYFPPHKDCRRFLEGFVSTILTTDAARSPFGRDLSCFSHASSDVTITQLLTFLSNC